MRDRRNTNLSISSASTVSPAVSPVVPRLSIDDIEKGRFLWLHPATPTDPLPSPLLKHARESQFTTTEKYRSWFSWKRALLALVSLTLLVCYHCSLFTYQASAQESTRLAVDERLYLVNINGEIPKEPTPVIFQDEQGKPRWTVSIPQSLSFPLRPQQYKDMCQASEKISKSVESMGGQSRILGRSRHSSRSYYAVDKAFMDVDEAERVGLLPRAEQQKSVSVVGGYENTLAADSSNFCDRTLTFVMETSNSGFGKSLLNLWMAYGLAKKEGREFFVDDTRWPYGNYAYYFPAPPKPSCAPPPAHHIVPCPHSARHLVASAATIPWTFGSAFKDEFTRPRRFGVYKNRDIYDMIRTGYEDLFALVGEDASFLERKLSVLKTHSLFRGMPIVGMHIRRGDRHPYELQFSNDYLPFERYTNAATALLSTLAKNLTLSPKNHASILLASDDPDIYDSVDLINTLPSDVEVVRSQERIVLASKKSLAPAVPLRNGAYTKHVDENSGWEGGFYTALFNGLGGGHPSWENPTEDDKRIIQQAMSLRQLVGRGYLLDLSVLGRADGVVCASSSAACRVLGVMMGWDKVVKGQWNNVDAGGYWSWDGQL